MAGTKAGAQKAKVTNLKKYGPDYYKNIGSQSWDDPYRSHETGFALLSRETVAELGRKGGKTNKGKKYKKHDNKTIYVTSKEITAELNKAYPKLKYKSANGGSPHSFTAAASQTEEDSPGLS